MRKRCLAIAGILALNLLSLAGCGDSKKSSTSKAPASSVATPEATKPAEAPEQGNDLSYDGYNMVWSDEFDAGKLNTEDWNVEVHNPGWVNNELQEYVVSDDNIFFEDGKLVIKPIKTGTSYTSGRINTQGKKDFTYGIFEASIKMPAGKGFLPAFWLMASDENVYGQWPRCGEIDIAEVLGDKTKTTYGTIHYGNPHNESQGMHTLRNGDFSSDFHTYAVEWLPGKINWYVDGILFHSTSNWYSKTPDIGEITYPAPFDQPFYVILNLAVGGNWPGNPNDSTDFSTARMEVDYVRVYQKDSYDEDIDKPDTGVSFREPDETGNYINNGCFAEESLTDEEDWIFKTSNDGVGEAKLEDGKLHIKTDKAGTEEYSIQVVQPGIPMYRGAEYELVFKAYASENRTMKVAVTAPNAGWVRYYPDTSYDLTTKENEFRIPFSMNNANDPTARLEFNMGKTDSVADIYISDVSIRMTKEPEKNEVANTILGDGNYVYNSKFQEGKRHLGFWNYEGEADYEVTPYSDGRRLKVTVPAGKTFTVSQKNLAISAGSEFILSFDSASDNAAELKVTVNNETTSIKTSKSMETTKLVFSAVKSEGFNDLVFTFGEGTYYLDNVRLLENVLIKNGSFNAGTSAYELYVDSSADAKFVVDSLTEDNALDFTVKNTGDQDWKIQLKQNDILLEQGKKYKLSYDAKSTINRKIRAVMQAQENKGWIVYSGENSVVELTDTFQTFTTVFTMEEATDAEAFLSICLGAVSEEQISEQHRVIIDNISLVEVK